MTFTFAAVAAVDVQAAEPGCPYSATGDCSGDGCTWHCCPVDWTALFQDEFAVGGAAFDAYRPLAERLSDMLIDRGTIAAPTPTVAKAPRRGFDWRLRLGGGRGIVFNVGASSGATSGLVGGVVLDENEPAAQILELRDHVGEDFLAGTVFDECDDVNCGEARRRALSVRDRFALAVKRVAAKEAKAGQGADFCRNAECCGKTVACEFVAASPSTTDAPQSAVLRSASEKLRATADLLEEAKLYDRADMLYDLATQFRLEARSAESSSVVHQTAVHARGTCNCGGDCCNTADGACRGECETTCPAGQKTESPEELQQEVRRLRVALENLRKRLER